MACPMTAQWENTVQLWGHTALMPASSACLEPTTPPRPLLVQPPALFAPLGLFPSIMAPLFVALAPLVQLQLW